MKQIAAILLLLSACASAPPPPPPPVAAPTPIPPPDPIANFTMKMQRIDGYLPLYWDHVSGMAEGVGSTPIGLDRGEMGESHLVRFTSVGPKVLLERLNERYRALSEDENERRDVEDSFPKSVLWAFKAETFDLGGNVLVDATDFFLSDQHGIADRLRGAKQGSYSLDRNRSAIFLPRTRAFPRNTEVEATLTFETRERPGRDISSVAPQPELVSVRQHQSFIPLPPPAYKPRRQDPRTGVFGIEFSDYASPFTAPLEQRWIARHRLEKKDPGAAAAEPVAPIVYYVAPGAPEPIRSAII